MSLRAQNKAKARQAILDAAHTLIVANGVGVVTTREIAEGAGVSYQTLYNYFPTKNAVLRALLRDDLEQWSSAAHFIIKRYEGDLLQTLSDVAALGIEHFDGPRSELWLAVAPAFIQRQPQDAERVSEGVNSLLAIAAERYHELLAMAQGTGELTDDVDLGLLAYTIFTLHDHALLRFLIDPNQSLPATLQVLNDQMHMLIGPYIAHPDTSA